MMRQREASRDGADSKNVIWGEKATSVMKFGNRQEELSLNGENYW